MTDESSQSITRYEWERILRRVRLYHPMTKYVGMVLAQYANTDGTNAYPSVAKLARVCEVSERTVRTALGELRERELIVRTRKGGLRGDRAFSDAYDLAIPADLLTANDLLGPDEGPLPNRQEVPPGDVPNRHVTQPQPARGSSQPANDDVPTGTTCLLPNPDQPIDLTKDRTSGLDRTQPQEGVGPILNNVISISRRRGA